MFSDNRLKSYADLLGLTVDELNDFMKRYKRYLQSKEKITRNVLINGLFILEELHADKWAIEANKVKYHTKNLIIIKYMDEILELYQQGLGATRIINHLKLNHRVNLSKSALDRFIATNSLKRGQNDG
jgi:hypothetical protein